MTFINELKDGSKRVEATGNIIEHARRNVGQYDIQEMMLKDQSGSIKLIVFDSAIAYKVGDRVAIRNGYVKSYKETLQLSPGKYGEIDLLSGLPGGGPASQEPDKTRLYPRESSLITCPFCHTEFPLSKATSS